MGNEGAAELGVSLLFLPALNIGVVQNVNLIYQVSSLNNLKINMLTKDSCTSVIIKRHIQFLEVIFSFIPPSTETNSCLLQTSFSLVSGPGSNLKFLRT